MSLACPSLILLHHPDLCRVVDIYCERTTPTLGAEPVNALTNIAFLMAAAAAWRLQSHCLTRVAAGLIRTLILVTGVVGLGSFIFHTIATVWAKWCDVIPIFVFMLLYLWLVLTDFLAWALWAKLVALSMFFGATFYLQLAVPNTFLMGGALYFPALFVMVAVGAALYQRQRGAGKAMFAATGVFLLSFTARTLDVPICKLFPLGTHFLWHVLNAVLLYLLLRIAILYTPRGTSATFGKTNDL
jgi:hypothetical protein